MRLALFALLIAFASCSTSGSKIFEDGASAHAGPSNEAPQPQFENAAVTPVYDHYLHVKNALVNSDGKEAKLGALALQSALNRMKNEKAALLAGTIAGSADLKVQRAEFDALSEEVEKLIKSSKIKSGIIYKQYCPMAKDGNGAYWLSHEAEIRNPYYGDEMLECGEVTEEIK